MKFYDRLWLLVKNDITSVEHFFTGTAWPFVAPVLKQIEEDSVVALKPVAEQAVAYAAPDLAALLTGGVPAVVAAAIPQALQLAKAAGIDVVGTVEHDLVVAVHAAVATAQAKLQPAKAP